MEMKTLYILLLVQNFLLQAKGRGGGHQSPCQPPTPWICHCFLSKSLLPVLGQLGWQDLVNAKANKTSSELRIQVSQYHKIHFHGLSRCNLIMKYIDTVHRWRIFWTGKFLHSKFRPINFRYMGRTHAVCAIRRMSVYFRDVRKAGFQRCKDKRFVMNQENNV